MTSLLPQFQEEENKKFDEITFCYIHHGRIPASCDQCFLQKQVKLFLSSSHTRLINKIVEMIRKNLHDRASGDEFDMGWNDCAYFIQSKLKQI